jgi:hypothetical protein
VADLHLLRTPSPWKPTGPKGTLCVTCAGLPKLNYAMKGSGVVKIGPLEFYKLFIISTTGYVR